MARDSLKKKGENHNLFLDDKNNNNNKQQYFSLM